MRRAYTRYGGPHGSTAAQFAVVASEGAGTDLARSFHRALDTTAELDYMEMLELYGLRFAGGEDPTARWKLEVRQDATPAQRGRQVALVAP